MPTARNSGSTGPRRARTAGASQSASIATAMAIWWRAPGHGPSIGLRTRPRVGPGLPAIRSTVTRTHLRGPRANGPTVRRPRRRHFRPGAICQPTRSSDCSLKSTTRWRAPRRSYPMPPPRQTRPARTVPAICRPNCSRSPSRPTHCTEPRSSRSSIRRRPSTSASASAMRSRTRPQGFGPCSRTS